MDIDRVDKVNVLADTVDDMDPVTFGHSRRVAGIAALIGQFAGLSGEELVSLHAASLLHDVGKISIPSSILTKPRKLTEDEWQIMRAHCAEGAKIVGYVGDLSELLPIILHHHEWYDGTGYPEGLKGEEIPLGARIISVADAYDSMTTPRDYREVSSSKEALEELRRCSGTQFDPELVEVCCRVITKTLLE